MPAFFRLALTTVAVKSLSPNFPHGPLVTRFHVIAIRLPRACGALAKLVELSTTSPENANRAALNYVDCWKVHSLIRIDNPA